MTDPKLPQTLESVLAEMESLGTLAGPFAVNGNRVRDWAILIRAAVEQAGGGRDGEVFGMKVVRNAGLAPDSVTIVSASLLAEIQEHLAVGCTPQRGYVSRHTQLAVKLDAAMTGGEHG